MEITPTNERLGGVRPAERFDEAVTLGQLAGYGGTTPYRKYVALVSQALAAPPSAVILENTLGGTPTWSYSAAGTYNLTLTGAFTASKTALYFTSVNGELVAAIRVSDNIISVQSYNPTTGIGADDLLNTNTLEIRVYQ